MIRKLVLKIFLRLYIGRNRDIVKLTTEQELEKFKFKSSYDIEEILKTYMTRATITYWEARSDYERSVEKGGALILKFLLDMHKAAIEADKEKIESNKLKKFVSLKNNLLAR